MVWAKGWGPDPGIGLDILDYGCHLPRHNLLSLRKRELPGKASVLHDNHCAANSLFLDIFQPYRQKRKGPIRLASVAVEFQGNAYQPCGSEACAK